MATQSETARFYRLALRVGLLDTAAIDRWVDSVIVAAPAVVFPFTELAGASRRRREDVDDLLGQVPFEGDRFISARMVLALLRRRLQAGAFAPESAIKLAMEIARAGDLTQEEYYRADHLDDDVWLATNETYGDLATVRRRIGEFLDEYAKFDDYIPAA